MKVSNRLWARNFFCVRPRWGRGRERGVDACPQVTLRRSSGITQRLLLKCDLFEVELGSRGEGERSDACPQVTLRRGSGITQRLLLKCDLFEVELGIGGRSSGCGGGGKAID